MNAAGFQGAPLYRGIEREVFDRLIWGGHAAYHFAVPMSSNKEVKIDRLRYDPERLKLLLEQLAVEAGITLLYETELTAARRGRGGVSDHGPGAVSGDRPLRKIPDRRHRKRLPGPGCWAGRRRRRTRGSG